MTCSALIKSTRRLCSTVLLSIGAIALASSAAAVPVSYTLIQQMGQVDSSFIHSAEGPSPSNPIYFDVGETFFQADGQIQGDLTAGVLTLSASTLTLTVTSPFITPGSWTFEILGGVIGDAGGGLAQGTLDYQLLRDGILQDAGTFFIDPLAFGGGPNTISSSQIFLWANNWQANPAFHGTTQSRADFLAGGGTPLGIDFLAIALPEPSVALLAAFAVVGLRRRPVRVS